MLIKGQLTLLCSYLELFAGMATDFNDKDEPIIVGVRPTGEKIGVSGMSDGIRDQLHLISFSPCNVINTNNDRVEQACLV